LIRHYPLEFIALKEAQGCLAANLSWGEISNKKGSKMPEKATGAAAKTGRESARVAE
jgi:hypothetical protein